MTDLRLKSYRTFYADGRSSTTFDIADESRVFVAIILGDEPLKITDDGQYLDIDSAILKMAAHIHRARAARKPKLKKQKRK